MLLHNYLCCTTSSMLFYLRSVFAIPKIRFAHHRVSIMKRFMRYISMLLHYQLFKSQLQTFSNLSPNLSGKLALAFISDKRILNDFLCLSV